MTRLREFLISFACLALLGPALVAQPPARPDLLELVPDDFGLCLVLRDLRGQDERWQKSDWVRAFRASAAGKAIFESPELRPLFRAEQVLKKTFDVDWPTLRDEVLGDEVVLAYRPGPQGKAEEEQGIILLWARRPELLAKLIDRFNEVQRQNGELRSLKACTYKGKTYQRRDDRGKEHFYYLDGPLLAVAGKEEVLQGLIDKRERPAAVLSAWGQRFRRAGAERAFLTLCVNPRVLDLNPGQQAPEVGALAGLWQALEAIFVTVQAGEALEVRLSIQAKVEMLPERLRPAFVETPTPSALWQRFPTQAVVTVAARTNFSEALSTLIDMTPPAKRSPLVDGPQRSLGAITGLDFAKDILPHIGPDWGFCLLAPADSRHLPLLLVALAVQPGSGRVPVDQALYKAVSLFAGLLVLDYNKNHLDALRLQTTLQDKVEVSFLQGSKFFPPGFRPAYALKDGYLLFASAPEALLDFRPGAAPAPQGEVPLLRLSARGLAGLLRQRQEEIVARLTKRQTLTPAEARQNLANLAEFLELVNRVEISRRSEAGQADWVLRVHPALARPIE
jgi:hypothetical protein